MTGARQGAAWSQAATKLRGWKPWSVCLLLGQLAVPGTLAALPGDEVAARLPGAHYVFDTAFSRNFSLLESQREFVRRFRGQAGSQQALPVLTSACPGVWSLQTEVGSRTGAPVLGAGELPESPPASPHFPGGDHRDA